MNNSQKNASKIVSVILFFTSLILLSAGLLGLIENKPPLYLESLTTLVLSLILYFEYYIMIFLGSLGTTVSTWYMQKNQAF
jgi:hypothetical protein